MFLIWILTFLKIALQNEFNVLFYESDGLGMTKLTIINNNVNNHVEVIVILVKHEDLILLRYDVVSEIRN